MSTVVAEARAGTHTVQFYERERFLHRAIERFFSQALSNGDPVAMIARRRTFEAVVERLARGHDMSPFEAADRILFLDVNDTLQRLLTDGLPDAARAEEGFMSLLTRIRRGRRDGTVWIYGEMSDVLCKSGDIAAAIQFEGLWSQFSGRDAAAVMCGCAIGSFDADADAAQLGAICRQHTHVVPTEDYADSPEDRIRFEQVAVLHTRASVAGDTPARDAPPRADSAAGTPAATMVYVVDDDLSVRQSLARLLGSADFPVRTFDSAEAFLAEVDARAAGCLLVDVQLTGMSGMDLQIRLTEAGRSIPVIAMSASPSATVESETLRLGARAFLRKPFTAEALLDAIARATG